MSGPLHPVTCQKRCDTAVPSPVVEEKAVAELKNNKNWGSAEFYASSGKFILDKQFVHRKASL